MQLHQWSHSPHKATGECVSAFDVAALVALLAAAYRSTVVESVFGVDGA